MLSEQAARPGPGLQRERPPPAALEQLLDAIDVRINGNRPWDLRIIQPRVYRRLFRQWSLGAGESYMDGDWECDQLDEFFTRLMRADHEKRAFGPARWALAREVLRQSLFNLQTTRRAFQVGEQHYDAGNDVFEAMLDSRMIYSCAYWPQATTLEQAQEHKLELICRKLQLRPGEHLLDIGCGWGGLARFAAERHGVRVTGVTVSRQQLALAQQRCRGLDIELRLQDYRDIEGRFDKIVSVGMFEHVGPKNYAAYFDVARRVLAADGVFLLHTIGLDTTSRATDPWIDKYVFCNGKLPSAREITAAVEGRFLVEDWHNFGPDYDRTLMSWAARFEAAWPRLKHNYDERFRRMWRYYLLCCAGFFRARQGQLWQLVLSRRDRSSIYRSVR